MKLHRKIALLTILSLSMILLKNVTPTHAAEDIKIAGGAGPAKNVLLPIKDAFEKTTGIKLIIMELGGTAAFKELVKGNQDIGSAGFSYDELFQELGKEGGTLPDKSAYRPVVVAKANVSVLIHKENPVAKLSKEQLKGIFTGKIQNWKDVGGADAPILITLAKLNPATNATFKNQVLDGESFTKEIAETTTADEVQQFVAGSAEAVGFGPSSLVGGMVKAVDTPPIERVITFITKGAPSPKVQKLYDFIAGDGQKYIKK
jgi:phosphate transport system substrate-binding protein